MTKKIKNKTFEDIFNDKTIFSESKEYRIHEIKSKTLEDEITFRNLRYEGEELPAQDFFILLQNLFIFFGTLWIFGVLVKLFIKTPSLRETIGYINIFSIGFSLVIFIIGIIYIFSIKELLGEEYLTMKISWFKSSKFNKGDLVQIKTEVIKKNE